MLCDPLSFFLFRPEQGGFARCYELIDTETNKMYAGKVVAKSLLTKPHQKDKVSSYKILLGSLTLCQC